MQALLEAKNNQNSGRTYTLCYHAYMTGFEIALGITVILAFGTMIVLQMKKPQVVSDNRDWSKDIAKIEKELEIEKAEHNKLSGGNKQMFAELTQAKAKLQSLEKERDALQKTVTKYETEEEQDKREHKGLVEKQDAMLQALREERQRVLQAEAEAKQVAEEERDRLWNDHEVTVISTLIDLCKQPHLQFKSYSNNSLPDDFDGSLKPDFLIDFLGQYVVFDAKVSKSQSLQTYIDDQVKKTAEKMKKNDKIYPHIFLVVPTEAVAELKKLVYAKDQYYFYVISREALSPILASLKRISTYELAETLDPQKRENIINTLAEMTTQINMTSATSLLTTKRAVEVLARMQKADPELAAEVEQKSKEKTLNAYSPTELKRLASSLTAQNSEINSLASPKPPVSKKMIEAAESVISQKLL